MHQLNYALVPERSSDVPVYRKGWRPIKPRYKPYARPAAGIGVAAALATRRRLHKDVRPRAPAATHQEVVQMDVDPAPCAHNLEIPAVRHHPEISAEAPKARSALSVCGMGFPTPVLETPAATHQEPIVQIDVDPAPRAHNIEIPAGNVPDPAGGRPEISADVPKAKWGGWGSVFDSPDFETPAATRQRMRPWHILYPDLFRGRPEISADVPKAKWGGWGSVFDSPDFETPAATRQRMRPWHILYPDLFRGPEISADAPKAGSDWGGRGSAYGSPVLESTSVSHRKRKAHEEYSACPKAKKARIDLPAPSAESSPISSRKAEKSRARDEPVGVPPTSLRKAEKARARNDPAESVDATPSTCSGTVKESRLPAPIRRPIMAVNMASSSRVKLEDISVPADVDKAKAVINLSPLAIVTNVQVNNTSSTSLNRPIEKPVFPPRDPTIVASRKPGNSDDVPDIIMFEDDYVSLPPVIDIPDIIMIEDDYVDLPPFIAGYVPEYGDYMQLDPVGRPDEVNPFNAAPLAIRDYVYEPMDIEWVGPSVPSGNPLGNIEAHPRHAGPPVPPFYTVPQVPVPSYHVQLFAPEALNAPAIIPVQEQPIGHVDDRAELFDELFGNDGEEEDEEEEEDAGTLNPPWTAAGNDRVEEHGDDDDEVEDEVEIII